MRQTIIEWRTFGYLQGSLAVLDSIEFTLLLWQRVLAWGSTRCTKIAVPIGVWHDRRTVEDRLIVGDASAA
ncbi:hypothetical protein [Nonomuraea dietziae]|uniref:hypothetical protein n=1 Tax=Nonomuraea dietziae TaxID=65515 RepID=UPI0031DF9A14